MSDDEDDQHDLIGDDESDKASDGAPAHEEEEEEESTCERGEEEEEEVVEEAAHLYVYYNRQYYKFSAGKEDTPGFVRSYGRIVKVPSGKALGMMVAGPEGWPSGEELFKKVTADKIVVVSGKMKEDDTDFKNVWYCLVEVDGQANRQDHLIARHIPKKVYMEIIDHIKSDPNMATSSLLTMLAHENNAKAINPQINGFTKMIGEAAPKSGMVAPEKKTTKAATEKAPSAGDKKADGAKKQKANADNKKAPTAAAANDDAALAPSPAPDVKEKKVSASSFFKPKPVVDKAAAPVPASPGGGMPTDEGKEKKEEKQEKKEEKQERPSIKRKPDDNCALTANPPYKRTRTEQQETFEFLICDASQRTMEIPIPQGCTGGKIVATFQFQ